jgi:glycosyltransferase involved in cell wall biosynthesis
VPSTKTKLDIKRLGIKKDKIVIINPTFAFKANRYPTRKPGSKILFVGNIEPRKGLDILLKALSLISNVDFSCDIVGSCSEYRDYFDHLKSLVAQFGLSNRVGFHGKLEPDLIVECYRKANIFVFPSLHEGYGMVLREAMCFGLPVIASDVAPLNETIEDGTNGYLFPPGDEKALADALRTLLLDFRTQEKIGRRNFKESRLFPSWDEVVSKTYDVLKPYLSYESSN